MDTNNNIQRSKPVPPFVRYCSAIIPTMFDDSLSYYEALCALNNFIQKNVVEVINNNASVTEEYIKFAEDLKEYVDTYFDNLDVQDEINNKLDEMVEDGTLASLLNVTAINQKLSILPEMFVECTKIDTLTPPTGYRVQSMDYDGVYWYVLYINQSENMVVRKYNSDFSNIELQRQLSVNGHGNTMCYFDGYLYVCNFNSPRNLNVFDPSDFSLVKTITLPVDTRGFAVKESNNKQIVVALENKTSGQVRFYDYMPDGNMQYLCSVQSEYTYTYRNGCKLITDSINNDRFLFGSCCSNSENGTQLNAYKGNTIEFWVPATDRRFKVGLLASGGEVQDFVHPVNSSNLYYIINNNGELFTANINLFSTSTNLAFLGGSTQTSDTVCLYTGSKAKMTTIGKYDSYVSGAAPDPYVVCNEFYLPINYTSAVGAFAVNGTYRYVASNMKTNSTNIMGRIDVPLHRIHSYNGVLYEIDGYIGYNTSDYTATNILGSSQHLIKCVLGNNTDVRIKETNLSTGTITFNRYQNYADLKTRVQNDNIGFVFGDIYPIYIRALGQIPNGAWELDAQPDIFDMTA